MAAKLADQSFHKFSHIPFEDFVRMAYYGLPSQTIDDFLREYEFLEVKVYSTFTRSLQNLQLLDQLKQSLKEIQADPFVYTAIERARQRVVYQRKTHVSLIDDEVENMKPVLDERLQWILEPLQQLLQSPDTARVILQRLKILKVRFHKLYRSPEANWGTFNTDTLFYEQIQWIDVSDLAKALSRKDQSVFSHCVVNAFYADDGHARRTLNTLWNRLSMAAEECMIAKVDVSWQIDHLAQELYRVCNYYSLTAIIQGIKASGLPSEALETFGYLIDPANNYQGYRQQMKTRPGMHFLYPALQTAARGSFALANMVINAHALYNVEGYQRNSFVHFFIACLGR
ncbi:hypothetical protein N7522_006362 [Penicillium canescens]|nr:hypothetical protein N7522_006362 [Penicillium canescens]